MIPVGDYKITGKDIADVVEVLQSNRISEGKKVKQFEDRWAEWTGSKYALLTNSGTSALIACLEALKEYTPHRVVHTTPLTFVATINAIILAGYTPTFSDVGDDFVLKPTLLQSPIFLPVHLYGYPVNIPEFGYTYMIEDCCEAHGTLLNGRKVGWFGMMACYSFYIAHNIQVGDMGAITTNSKELYKRLKQIRGHGRTCACPVCTRYLGTCPYKDMSFDPRFNFERIAYNFKSNEIQATLGLNQLEQADAIIKIRRENVKYLNECLADLTDDLQLPPYSDDVSYLAYPLVLKTLKVARDDFRQRIESKGVECRPLFQCVPTQVPAYAFMKKEWEGKLPNAERLGAFGIHLPIHQYLTKEDLDKIAQTVRESLTT